MKNTTIAWTDHTFNPWLGCRRVSPGCDHCYAETWGRRFGMKWGGPRLRTSAADWRRPLAWNRAAEPHGCGDCDPCLGGRADQCAVDPTRRPRVFCGSLCDIFDDEVPIEWLADFLDLVRVCRNLDFLLLTKRPQNFYLRLIKAQKLSTFDTSGMIAGWLNGASPDGIWLGASVEDQQRADERIPALLAIPAKVRFLSVEPMLGPVNLVGPTCRDYSQHRIGWVICGCESGPRRRPMKTEWALDLREQCRAAGVPFFAKQMEVNGKVCHDLAQFPEELRVREFPTT